MNPESLGNETPGNVPVEDERRSSTNTPSLPIMAMNNIAAEEQEAERSKKEKSKRKKQKRKSSNKQTSDTQKSKTSNSPRIDGDKDEEEEQQRGGTEGSSSQLNVLSLPIINSEDAQGQQSQKLETTPKKKKRKSSKKLSSKKLDEQQPDVEEGRRERRVNRLELAPPVHINNENIHEEDNAAAMESEKKSTESKQKKKRKSSKKSSTKKLDVQQPEEKEFEDEKKREKEQQNRIKLAASVYQDETTDKEEEKKLKTTEMKTKKSKKKLSVENDEKVDTKDTSHSSSLHSKNSKHQKSRHRPRVRAPSEDDVDGMDDDEASFDIDEAPGAHQIGGMRGTAVVADASLGQRDPPVEWEEQPQDSTETTTDLTHEHQVTTAQVVDEEALEREFADRKTVEIRNQILSNAASATEVKREKTFLQKYGVFCGCALVAISVAIVLAVTLSPDKEESAERLVGYDYLFDLVSSISNETVLLNETTPQYDALNWLAFEDTIGTPLTESNSEILGNSLKERYVVALLYFATQGTNWTKSYDFLTNTSVCEWPRSTTGDDETLSDGIRCNEDRFVDSVSLESNNMIGTLPSEIQALESLQTLRLADNGLHGQIPPSLGDMPSLRHLSLDQNSLTGEIPEDFGGLLGLEILSLTWNSLQGSLPSQVTLLPRLQEILLGRNFMSGSLPEFLPRGPMRRIKIGFNILTGSLPDTIYELSSLEELEFFSNDLTGSISSQIGNLISLKLIGLWLNNFEGALPSHISGLGDLIVLDVGANGLSNTIPTELGNLGRLEELTLEENALSGTIPTELQNLSNLKKLNLGNNQLSGLVPIELGTLASLRVDGLVDLHNNSFTGSLDSVFCTGLQPPIFLKADCSEIECSCCTDCCDDATASCEIKVDEICQRKVYEAEQLLPLEVWGTTCSCRDVSEGVDDGFAYVDCSDTCHTCNPEGNFCLEKYRYGFDIPNDTGLDNLFSCNMRYIPDEAAPDRNEDISFSIDYYTVECSVSINGIPCNTCSVDRKCADGFTGVYVDCSNIEDDAIYDACSLGLDGGELLQFLRPEYFQQECPPCIFL